MINISALNERFFSIEYSQEKKCFNLGQIAVMFVYVLLFLQSILFRYDYTAIISVGSCAIITYGLYFIGKLTEKYSYIAMLISLIFNIYLLPFMYISSRRIFSGVIIVFIFGMLYSVITMTGLSMLISLVLSITAYILSTVYVFLYFGGSYVGTMKTSGSIFLGQLLSVVFIGWTCGICVKKLVKIYTQEQEKATEMVHKSEIMSDSKDTFLSNMSHEIRTPMNAILGTSQLLLEGDLEEEEQDKVLNILNASNALLSSINDMLDITRIETGIINIEEEEYDFSDMLTDIINMISVRVMDRNIEFIVFVDPEIPRKLYGDGKRIRQVFINILNNAVKYTKEGLITLTINREVYLENEILITASIKDTGVGIKDSDKEKLFVEFERLDTVSSGLENVEGTGLGLSICKEILKSMDGDISFDSVYNEGTEFFFRVPQTLITDSIDSEASEKMGMENENFSSFKVLVFEKSEECDNAIASALSSLHIEAESAFGVEMFRTMLLRGNYSHIIIDRNNYYSMEDFLKNHLNNTKLIIVTDINKTETKGCPGAIMIRPVYTANLSDYFSGKRHSLIRRINVRGNFIAPNATVMTVDDNLTNLHVVESFLKKYKMKVLTASGGKEAVLKLENEKADLIFLDYMMPDMDGVDTLKNIRKLEGWAKNVPVICLTANAVGGVREMLLGEGFDDYISKPIELSKLERALLKYLPEDMIESNTEE